MTLKKTAYILICFLCACVMTNAQNANDTRLVDSRVTLDDKRPSAQPATKSHKQEPTQKKQQPSLSTTLPSNQNESLSKLPSSFNGVSVTARLDTSSITIGEQTTLHINIECGEKKTIHLPQLDELNLGAIEALEMTVDTLRDNSGRTSIEQRITITSFEAGKHFVNGIRIGIIDGGNTVFIAPSDTLALSITYLADADTTKCEMMKDASPLKEPMTFWEIIRWFVLCLIAAAIAAIIIWVIKRRKEHKPIVVLPKAKPVPADKKALSELETLRRKELWQKGRIKRYYTEITDIVRRFLRNMYGISAAEMTTRQTLQAFHGIEDWSEDSESMLRQLLQKADMVKFAKSQPESYEHDAAMQKAIDFIRNVAETHRINNPDKEDKQS